MIGQSQAMIGQSQVGLNGPTPGSLCFWCQAAPATQRVIATDACAECAADPAVRVTKALERWRKGAKK